jgi:hypothetical protein
MWCFQCGGRFAPDEEIEWVEIPQIFERSLPMHYVCFVMFQFEVAKVLPPERYAWLREGCERDG